MKCTVCEISSSELAFMKNGYNILRCKNCGHLFAEITISPAKVNEIYSDNYFFGATAGYPDYTSEKDVLIERGENYADLIKNFTIPGRVLDIGSAAGFILKGLENCGWQGIGIEPNCSMAKYGRNVVGVNIINSTLETVDFDEKFDLAVMIQVIAHLNNPNDSIGKIYNYLKPGGHILIETWNKDSITAKLFGKYWHELFPPFVINYFSKITLNLLMTKNGFSLVSK